MNLAHYVANLLEVNCEESSLPVEFASFPSTLKNIKIVEFFIII